MIAWIIEKILPALKSKVREEYEGLFVEVKDLRDFYKQEAKEQREKAKEQSEINRSLQKQIEQLKAQNQDQQHQISEVRDMEELCLKQQAEMAQRILDAEERTIFKTKGRHKGDDIP